MLKRNTSFHRIFWLGLEKLHQLTSSGKWRLKVKVTWDKNALRTDDKFVEGEADSRAGTVGESEWDDFRVRSEATDYQLRIGTQLSKQNWEGDPFHGVKYLRDSIFISKAIINGMRFSTRDRDHDRWNRNCASSYYGGWWHKACSIICLTCNRPNAVMLDYNKWRLPSFATMWIKKV